MDAYHEAVDLVNRRGDQNHSEEGALKRSIVLIQQKNGRVQHTVEQPMYPYPLLMPLASAPSPFDGLVIDIRGWRKRYLLMLLIVLSWLAALNLLLTLWISRAINFSISASVASIAIKANSLRADEVVNFLDDIAVKNIHSRIDEPIIVQSLENITLSSTGRIRNDTTTTTSCVSIGPDRLDVQAESFSIYSADGRLVYQAASSHSRSSVPAFPTSQAVSTAAHTLRITGRSGVRFEDGVSLQTPIVTWGDTGGLRVESATRELHVKGPKAVSIESSEAGLTLKAKLNLTLTSSQGQLILSADSIHLEKLRSPLASKAGKAYGGVYQLCACASGRLFLAAPAAPCRAHELNLCKRL